LLCHSGLDPESAQILNQVQDDRDSVMKKLQFPENFLWGAATSSHQVEGGTNNQWSEWEKKNAERLAGEARKKWQPWQQEQFPEMFQKENYISGQACDHYNRFEQDFDIAKELGHNAHRFSIEWSRIEPEEGKFDEKEIEHYRNVLLALRAREIEPFVTLWHWTEPVWFNESGGWNNKKSPEYFARFVEKVVVEYKDLVKFWVVVNEPNVSMGFGYFLGTQPPAKKGAVNFLGGYRNLFSAFEKATITIRKIDKNAEIGVANSITDYQAKIFPVLNSFIVWTIEFFSRYFLRKAISHCTFIGCNYYSRYVVSFSEKEIAQEKRNDLGWEIYPEGISNVLKSLKKYSLPIYITENGLADAKDEKREKFIQDHLYQIHEAIAEGVDVRGYLHWSLLDNYEFPDVRGFWPRFGLVEVDFKTQERRIRPSALEYAKICKSNVLEIEE
jgi:beta-glucosidase